MPYHPLPPWFTSFRDHQTVALKELSEAFDDGIEIGILDAPTGTGKSLIGQQVAAKENVRSTYICSDKGLQTQFLRDFNYSKLLQGRGNYHPVRATDPDITCEDCTAREPGGDCWWCPDYNACPYQVAKQEARRASLSVLNTSYLLTEANYVGGFSGVPLVIVDECDMLESSLVGFIEYVIGEGTVRRLGLTLPPKGIRKPALNRWLSDFALRLTDEVTAHEGEGPDQWEMKRINRQWARIGETQRIMKELERDANDKEDGGNWLRTYGDDKYPSLSLRPVRVGGYGNRYLWRHSEKFLLMSATVISAQELVASLGITRPWHLVTVPMTFPKENRPIILAPVANMTHKEYDAEVPKLLIGIKNVLRKHEGQRVLIHAVSYKLAKAISRSINGRPVFTYTNASERADALSGYLSKPGAVLIAPSLERGVDLVGDKCDVIIVAKIPFMPTNDRIVGARLYSPGGQLWYAVNTIRDLVQMTGRGVRNENDTCTTYIMDAQFGNNLWKKNRHLIPSWWKEAIRTDINIRDLMIP